MRRYRARIPHSIAAAAAAVTDKSSSSVLPRLSSCVRAIHNIHDDIWTRAQFTDEAQAYNDGIKIRERERGRVYQKRQQLWPNLSALEKDMTVASFAPAERTPPELLPRDVAELQLQGRIPAAPDDAAGGLMMLAKKEQKRPRVLVADDEAAPTINDKNSNHDSSATPVAEETTTTSSLDDFDDLAAMQLMAAATSSSSSSSSSSVASSVSTKRKAAILADLQSNEVISSDNLNKSDAIVTSWSAVGLDPDMEQRAMQLVGKGATRSQSRLLPALLDDAHNDVIFGSITGSGKTVALLLAMIQGLRNETAGLNIFVASDEVNAIRAANFLKKFCGESGEFVDCGVADDAAVDDDDAHQQETARHLQRRRRRNNWLYLAFLRENFEQYFRDLTSTLKNPQDTSKTRVLICTADVLCQLLFEKKLEFAPFGNLRRLYVDDIGKDVRFASPTASVETKRRDYVEPSATQLALATVHQLMPVHDRSLMQLGCVSADMESDLSQHLLSLCVKPAAHSLIACAARLPSTLHCVFSFCVTRTPLVSSDTQRNYFEYLARLLRNAAPIIPGRVLIFFPTGVDLLGVKTRLMKEHGLDAKLMFEVHKNASSEGDDDANKNTTSDDEPQQQQQEQWAVGWRYLLLHEDDGFGLDIPLVSHVVLTFCPRNRFSFLHLAGRAARGGQPGWVFCVTPREEALHVASICKELDVDVTGSTVDVNLHNVPRDIVKRWTAPLYKPTYMDPQKLVESRYDEAEDPLYDTARATMFRHDKTSGSRRHKDMILEDYTPLTVLDRRQKQVQKLRMDILRTPELAVKLAREGLLSAHSLRPTKKLIETLDKEGEVDFTRQLQEQKRFDEKHYK